MAVYVEYVLIDNFVITALLCLISAYLCAYKVKRIRVIGAAAVGTAVALFLPFVGNLWALFAIRAGLCAVIVIIMAAPRRLRAVLKYGAVFLGMTFLFGGALFAAGYIIMGDVYAALTVPFADMPLGAVLGGAAVVFWVARRMALHIKRARTESAFAAQAVFEVMGKTHKVRGFIDSGNGLYDTKTGLPVIVVGLKTFLNTFDPSGLIKVAGGEGEGVCKGARYIEVETVTGKDRLLLLPCDKFVLYPGDNPNTIYKAFDVMVGVRANRGTVGANYDAILHPCMLGT